MFDGCRPRFMRAMFALSVALLLVGLLLWLYPFLPAHAQYQPDALGSISGTVRNQEGQPLPGIRVGRFQSSRYSASWVTTDQAGAYHFPSVPPGAYRIEFEDSGQFYARTYYADASLPSEADVVNVSGNDIGGIDTVMVPGGSISVTIHSLLPSSPQYLYTELFRQTSTKRYEEFGPPNDVRGMSQATEIVFRALPAGIYRFCAEASPYSVEHDLYADECYDNTLPDKAGLPTIANDIVISGTSHETITMILGDIIQLQGIVKSVTGEPVPNAFVVDERDCAGDAPRVETDSHGYFHFFGLCTATHTLVVGADGYVTTFYDGATTYDQAKRLEIGPSSRYSLTLTLFPGGIVTGAVRFHNGVFPDSLPVEALPDEPHAPDLYHPSYSQYDPATGTYTITGLMTGDYRVKASYGDVESFYGGQDFQSAAIIRVIAGKTTPNINITLPASLFEATIRGSATADGIAKPGIEVGLWQDFPTSLSHAPLVATVTDAQGQYHFDGLTDGSYFVGFYDPQGTYATTFYDKDYLDPTLVLISGPMKVDHIDGILSPGSTIRGQIRRKPGNNLADFPIYVYVESSNLSLRFTNVHSDVNGNYAVSGLPPGTYWLSTTDPDNPDRQYWSSPKVTVGEGVVINGVDILLDAVPSVYLPVIVGGGQAAQ